MTRPLRIEFPGAVYHVTSRGNRHAAIFTDADDRRTFLRVLGEATARFNLLCHAYCLMDNHYHLLLETPEANLSRYMRHLNGVYTQTFNLAHHKCGHLLQGRYAAILVSREEHLLEACRYVVLNPVRAGVCDSPAQYTWSSYRATAGLAKAEPFLTTRWILERFATGPIEAAAKYSEFVLDGGKESIWEDLIAGSVLGNMEFASHHLPNAVFGSGMHEIAKEQRYANRPPLETLLRADGDIWEKAKEAADIYGFTQNEIAAKLGVHFTTVSRHLRHPTS